MKITLDEVLQNWESDHIRNLCVLLGIDGSPSLEEINNKFKWLYHSKARAGTESAVKKIRDKFRPGKSNTQQPDISSEALREIPSYTELVLDACKHLKATEEDATLSECELFLSQAVIVAALQSMKPRERVVFFEQQIDVASVMCGSHVKGTNLNAPLTTAAMLGLAQASGFGIYIASTTALGFLTHAVGVTLPFAVYSGMTSTIAFVIGPVGWLTAGIWGGWKLTQPKWKKIIPTLMYIIAINSRRGSGESI